jgi:uncharacterized protein YbjT (DUF2867 family)
MQATTARIAIVGATSRVGRHVVDLLQARGHDVVPISRATGVDVITGDGFAEALDSIGRAEQGRGPGPHRVR